MSRTPSTILCLSLAVSRSFRKDSIRIKIATRCAENSLRVTKEKERKERGGYAYAFVFNVLVVIVLFALFGTVVVQLIN